RAVRSARVETLEAVPGISPRDAQAIRRFFDGLAALEPASSDDLSITDAAAAADTEDAAVAAGAAGLRPAEAAGAEPAADRAESRARESALAPKAERS